jgi:hypothetical protein
LVVGAVLIGLSAWDLHTYQQLTKENTVAHLSFDKESDQVFMVTVTEPTGRSRKFRVNGDMWQLDARVIKWAPSIARIGITPGFRLDRLSGRYYSLEQENTNERTVYGLFDDDSNPLDAWSAVKNFSHWFPWIDANYGSATFMPMADGALYEVKLTNSGLISRALNDRAQEASLNWQ